MRNTIYYKWFVESLTEQQQKEFRDMSINQQKDWYISYLERHYSTEKKHNHIKTNEVNFLDTDIRISINPKLEVVSFWTVKGSETKEDCQKIIDYLFKSDEPLLEYNTTEELVDVTLFSNEMGSIDVLLYIGGKEQDEDQTPIINQEDIDKIFK